MIIASDRHSLITPQSGLTAYLHTYTDLNVNIPGDLRIKAFLQQHVWYRSIQPAPSRPPKVVYNLARGPLDSAEAQQCAQRRDHNGKGQDSGICSLASAPADSSLTHQTQSSTQSETSQAPTSTQISTGIARSSQVSSNSIQSQSSSSSSAIPTPKPTAGPEMYVVSSKEGTPVDRFKSFIQQLDEWKVTLYTFDTISKQM